MEELITFTLWLGFSLTIGAIGRHRNIGFFFSFLWAILLSPIIGLAITLFSKPKVNQENNKSNILNQLTQLNTLNEKGILNDVQFEKEKNDLVEKLNNPINEGSSAKSRHFIALLIYIIVVLSCFFGFLYYISSKNNKNNIEYQDNSSTETSQNPQYNNLKSSITSTEKPYNSNYSLNGNITIMGNIVNIRETPSTNSKVNFQLKKGDVCYLIEKGPSENIKDKTDFWYKISYNGKLGWVFGAYTSYSKSIDSLCIVNEFAINPFDNNIKNSVMVYFNKKMNTSTNTEIKIEKDYRFENTIDTIKTIYWGKSFIKTESNQYGSGALLYVLIKDNNISLKNNLKIGQTAEEVLNYFKIKFDKSITYRSLVIKVSEEDETTLTFDFRNNIIEKITYSPYLD